MGHVKANTMLEQIQTRSPQPGKPMGNITEVCNTMNSCSLIYKMQEIKSNEQMIRLHLKKTQIKTKKVPKMLLCAMSFFIVELTARGIR